MQPELIFIALAPPTYKGKVGMGIKFNRKYYVRSSFSC
jgi:hypothetical protein